MDMMAGISPAEKRCLREVTIQFQYLFDIHSSECSSTNIVKHSIDTGDRPHIKQFAMCI